MSEILIHFIFQTLKIDGYSNFNSIILKFFEVSNTIHASMLVGKVVYTV